VTEPLVDLDAAIAHIRDCAECQKWLATVQELRDE
jgi:hypothetical protein